MLDYLEIKDFPSELSPIARGLGEVFSWYRSGELLVRKRDALLVATNAGAYAIGAGADWSLPPLVGSDGTSESIAAELEAKLAELPSDDGTMKAINPILIFQIAQLVIQLIKSLKS